MSFEYQFHEMTIDISKNYHINSRRTYEPISIISQDDKRSCIEFAFNMAYGAGEHRKYRSGGREVRSLDKIFVNTLQGKLAEYGLYQYLISKGLTTTAPDLEVYGKNKWDSFDLKCENVCIAVKSTKFFGQLLLLECKDWNSEGKYIPNEETGDDYYDSFVLVRVKCESGEKSLVEKMGKLQNISSDLNQNDVLEIFGSLEWSIDFPGFITKKDFMQIIAKNNILPKNASLGSVRMMDADNYYAQAGEMRQKEQFISRMKWYRDKIHNNK